MSQSMWKPAQALAKKGVSAIVFTVWLFTLPTVIAAQAVMGTIHSLTF